MANGVRCLSVRRSRTMLEASRMGGLVDLEFGHHQSLVTTSVADCVACSFNGKYRSSSESLRVVQTQHSANDGWQSNMQPC